MVAHAVLIKLNRDQDDLDIPRMLGAGGALGASKIIALRDVWTSMQNGDRCYFYYTRVGASRRAEADFGPTARGEYLYSVNGVVPNQQLQFYRPAGRQGASDPTVLRAFFRVTYVLSSEQRENYRSNYTRFLKYSRPFVGQMSSIPLTEEEVKMIVACYQSPNSVLERHAIQM